MTKTKEKLLNMTYIAMFTAVIAVCSWLSIPFGNIPFTMQTFAVFATILMLGSKRSAISVVLYMTIGAIGVPVFSNFRGGLGVILGPTGGYMVGFIAMCFAFLLAEKLPDRWYIKLASLLLGLVLLYVFGTVWFAIVYAKGTAGFVYAITVCVLPYIIPDLIKMSLALLLAKFLKPLMKV